MTTHRWYIIDKRTNQCVAGPFTEWAEANVARQRVGKSSRYGVFADSTDQPETYETLYVPADWDLIRDMERGK